MGSFSFWHWLIVLFVVAMMLVWPQRRDKDDKPIEPSGQPVFSSVTTHGEEAEHIDERLRKDYRRLLKGLVLLAFAMAVAWFWAR